MSADFDGIIKIHRGYIDGAEPPMPKKKKPKKRKKRAKMVKERTIWDDMPIVPKWPKEDTKSNRSRFGVRKSGPDTMKLEEEYRAQAYQKMKELEAYRKLAQQEKGRDRSKYEFSASDRTDIVKAIDMGGFTSAGDTFSQQYINNPPPDERVYIIAGNLKEARRWAQDCGINPRQAWRYIRGPEDLRGLMTTMFVFVGTWAERADAKQIYTEVEWIRESAGRK